MKKICEFILGVLTMILFMFTFVAYAYLFAAIEDDIRCKNGATEYCIGDNYAKEDN